MINRIVEWNKARQLHMTPFSWEKEFSFIAEELAEGLRDSHEHDKIDAMADMVVFAIGAMFKRGYDPEIVMDEVLKEIESRKGYFDTEQNKFIKTNSKEDMLKADYERARIKSV